jgi:hypothetical protein
MGTASSGSMGLTRRALENTKAPVANLVVVMVDSLMVVLGRGAEARGVVLQSHLGR